MDYVNISINKTVFELFKRGDSIAFEEIYNLYSHLIYRKVNRLCQDSEICSDIVQESFTKLFLNRQKIADSDGIFPYLYTISRRLAISSFRKSISEMEYQVYLEKHYDEKEQSLMEVIVSKDLSDKIQDVLESLPEQQAKVFKLNKIDDLSYKEIAEELGVSPHTVRNQIAMATKIIRFKLNKLLTLFFL